MNYCFLTQRTRFLFLFRRLNGCHHEHSCIESVFRKLYDWVAYYGLLRIPLYYIFRYVNGPENNIMDRGSFIMTEIIALLLLGGLNSAGCFIRYMSEEIITQT